MAIRNKETEEESNRINNEIDAPEEEEEDEDKKMEMFFSLIRNYQEARKRRRQELIEDSGETAQNPTKRSDNGIAPPVLRAEDFTHCSIDLNLKPSNSIVSTEEEKKKEEEEEETEKEKTREENVLLDLNLAL